MRIRRRAQLSRVDRLAPGSAVHVFLAGSQRNRQGHPTTECFQIREKYLRWFSLRFRGLFGQFGVALKAVHLFGYLGGTLNVTKILGCVFLPLVLSQKIYYIQTVFSKFNVYVM